MDNPVYGIISWHYEEQVDDYTYLSHEIERVYQKQQEEDIQNACKLTLYSNNKRNEHIYNQFKTNKL